MAKDGIKVRGACPEGHMFEGTAAPGRVTWSGPCPVEGCGQPLTARRVKRSDPAPSTPPATNEPAAGTLTIRKVTYADTPPPPVPEAAADPDELGGADPDELEPDALGGNPGISIPRGSAPDDAGSAGGDDPDALELAGGRRKRFGRGRARPVGPRGTYAGIPY